MGRSDGKKFVLSKDVRGQKAGELLIAVILALLPVLFSRWADFSTYQRLLCAGGGGFVACTVVFCDWPKLSTVFIIENRQIKSRRWGKVLCEVRCTGMVHYLFVRERIEDASLVTRYYLLISNRVIPNFAGQSVLKTYDIHKQILLRYDKETEPFLRGWLGSENWICDGGAPPDLDAPLPVDKEPIIPKDIHKQFIEEERTEWRQFKELLRSLRKK